MFSSCFCTYFLFLLFVFRFVVWWFSFVFCLNSFLFWLLWISSMFLICDCCGVQILICWPITISTCFKVIGIQLKYVVKKIYIFIVPSPTFKFLISYFTSSCLFFDFHCSYNCFYKNIFLIYEVHRLFKWFSILLYIWHPIVIFPFLEILVSLLFRDLSIFLLG